MPWKIFCTCSQLLFVLVDVLLLHLRTFHNLLAVVVARVPRQQLLRGASKHQLWSGEETGSCSMGEMWAGADTGSSLTVCWVHPTGLKVHTVLPCLYCNRRHPCALGSWGSLFLMQHYISWCALWRVHYKPNLAAQPCWCFPCALTSMLLGVMTPASDA